MPEREPVPEKIPKLGHEWRYVGGTWTDGDEVEYEFECTTHPWERKFHADGPGKENGILNLMNTNPVYNNPD